MRRLVVLAALCLAACRAAHEAPPAAVVETAGRPPATDSPADAAVEALSAFLGVDRAGRRSIEPLDPETVRRARSRPGLMAAEALRLLATRESCQVERGLAMSGLLAVTRLDDDVLRTLMIRVADAAGDELQPRGTGCGTCDAGLPPAAFHAAAAELLHLGVAIPDDLLALTRDERPEVRRRALDALEALPSEAVRDRLIEMLRDPVPLIRGKAATMLDRLRPCGSQSALAPLLGDPDRNVRRHVAVLLATCGNVEALATLVVACDEAGPLVSPIPPPHDDGLSSFGESCRILGGITTFDRSHAMFVRLRHPDMLSRQGPWSAWWASRPGDFDPLTANVELLLQRESGSGPPSAGGERAVSWELIARACDEPCVRALSTHHDPGRPFSSRAEALERVRERLAPGALVAVALARDETLTARVDALRAAFRADRLLARTVQLHLLVSQTLTDVQVALELDARFPLPVVRQRDALLAWAQRDPVAALSLPRGFAFRDCGVAEALAGIDPALPWSAGCVAE